MCPDRGLTKEWTSGSKVVKNRITYLMCGNADGLDILPPFVIGKSAKPQAFKFNRAHNWAFTILAMPKHG